MLQTYVNRRMRVQSWLGIGACAFCLICMCTFYPLFAQTQQELVGNDTAADDYFGSSVSIHNDLLLIGAFYDDEPHSKSGAGFIFERNGSSWSQISKLVSNSPATNDAMGFDVSIGGSVAVLGAPWDDTASANGIIYNAGSASVFVDSGGSWSELQKLTASDATVEDKFGWNVNTDGSTIAVGAPNADTNTIVDSGAVYLFTNVNGSWVEQAKLIDPDIGADQQFGRSTAIAGDVLAVGAYKSDVAADDAGAVYIFQKINGLWSHQETLTAADAAAGDGFGEYVAIDGNLLLIGSWLTDDNGNNSGSAYIFYHNGTSWVEDAKLLASDGASGDRLGFRVDIQNGVAAVGARADDHAGGFDAGSTYLFKQINGNWQQLTKLIAHDAQPEDNMGIGVAISSSVVASSAERSDQNGVDSGSVYIDDVPAGLPTPTPVPLSAALQISPVHEQASTPLTYEWLEIDGATGYTLVIYDLSTSTIAFNDTFPSSICSNNVCIAQPSGITLSSGSYTWLVQGFNAETTAPWSIYDNTYCAGLVQEAEAGNLNNFFVAVADASASNGAYIHVPDGTGHEWYGPVSGKQVDFCFEVDTPGTYRIKGWVEGIDNVSDAFFAQIDGYPEGGYLWDIPVTGAFTQDYVSDRGGADPVEVFLSVGHHYLSIYLREDGARLDKLELELVSTNQVQAASQLLWQPNKPNDEITGKVHISSLNDVLLGEEISLHLYDMFSYGLDFKRAVFADANGDFSFNSVPPGHYVLEIEPPLGLDILGPRTKYIEVLENSNQFITFDLIPLGPLEQ